jgi:hypothetical protein
MSCPDWGSLAARRAASPVDPPGWDQALEHLDGCAHCRPQALSADPTLLFRRLPAPALAADEVAAMRLRVATLRRAGELRGSTRDGRPRVWQPSWRRLAVAASLAAAVLVVDGVAPPPLPSAGPSAGLRIAALPVLAAELQAQPVLEEMHQPFDHVVQWNGDDLSVVLVLDERLDV